MHARTLDLIRNIDNHPCENWYPVRSIGAIVVVGSSTYLFYALKSGDGDLEFLGDGAFLFLSSSLSLGAGD